MTCAYQQKELRLWDGKTGAFKTSMSLQGAFAEWAGVSRDGKYVYAVEQDSMIRAYPWERLAPVEELRNLAKQRLAEIFR